jgi:triphosphoribosyl-dephospho-CoA synthase
VTVLATKIASAFKAACLDELDAPKPGNVHIFADGHRMTASEFLRSATAAAHAVATPRARVGTRILTAVEATLAAVGANTNLGIVLLCAPIAAAADTDPPDLRAALARVLDSLDIEDANLAFRAIVRASPAGLGRVEQNDVFEPATVTLRQAMAEAAHRDRIAYQYVSTFEDIFARGEPLLKAAASRALQPSWATLAVYLGFLSAFPDSHVARKHGAAAAEEVRRNSVPFYTRLQSGENPACLLPDLLAWDRSLKARGLNPGTSADLTVATLFTHRLRNILPSAGNSD